MPSNHLILCHPLLLLSSISPSIRVFSSESVLLIRWPKDWSFSFSISPSNEYSGLISFRIDLFVFPAVQERLSRVFFNTTIRKHQFFSTQPSLWPNSNIRVHDYWENHSFDSPERFWQSPFCSPLPLYFHQVIEDLLPYLGVILGGRSL